MKRSFLGSCFALCASLCGSVLATTYSLSGQIHSGECSVHFPNHDVSFYTYGSLEAGHTTGPHWPPDSSCHRVYSTAGFGNDPAQMTIHATNLDPNCTFFGMPVYGRALVEGDGCATVAGPNGVVLIPETSVALDDQATPKTLHGGANFTVQNISNCDFVMQWDSTGDVGGPWTRIKPL